MSVAEHSRDLFLAGASDLQDPQGTSTHHGHAGTQLMEASGYVLPGAPQKWKGTCSTVCTGSSCVCVGAASGKA